MSEEVKEETLVTNEFGTVTDKRVVYFRKKGWFSGGSREDVPLKHVTSVRLERKRHPLWGLIFLLTGLAAFAAGTQAIIAAIILLAIGALLLWGSPTVAVNTAGHDLCIMKGWPWDTAKADAFVTSLRGVLFKD